MARVVSVVVIVVSVAVDESRLSAQVFSVVVAVAIEPNWFVSVCVEESRLLILVVSVCVEESRLLIRVV